VSTGPHLDDGDIDLYVAGRLSDERQLRVEEHFIACVGCAARVEAVEDLAQGLRDTVPDRQRERVFLAAAAALAVVSVALAFRLQRARFELEGAAARTQALERELSLRRVPTLASTTLPGLMELRLEPGVRNGGITRLKLAPGTSYVLVQLDAREVGTPGSELDVSLYDAKGRRRVSIAAVKSSPEGVVSIVIPARGLREGEYTIAARAGDQELRVPFLAER
jgi:hypothetical protein